MAISRSASLTGGGKIFGDLTIDGDLTVNGSATNSYDEIVNGQLKLSDDFNAFDDTDTSVNAGLIIENTTNSNNEGVGIQFS